jgi:signal transduction histidine kinase
VRRHWLDLLIVFVALEGALEVVVRADAEGAPGLTPWLAAPLIALFVLSLLARRYSAFAAAAALWLIAAGLSFADGRLIPFTVAASIAGMAAAFVLGNLRDEVQGRLGLAIVLGSALIVMLNDPDLATTDVILLPGLFVLAWVAGFALRARSAQADAAEQRARVAVAEERARIARELHDIVAHAVSVMVLQVGAVRHRLPDTLAEDVDALTDVEKAGRTALAGMRRLLGAMRDEDAELAPAPGLERLDELLAEVRRAGLPVELQLDGEPVPLPSALDLSAYRIVQEGLTNTLKHAHATQATVRISYDADELGIEVRDDGKPHGTPGEGHGLVGIRERVKIFGGEMSATPAKTGFVLSTRLPLP